MLPAPIIVEGIKNLGYPLGYRVSRGYFFEVLVVVDLPVPFVCLPLDGYCTLVAPRFSLAGGPFLIGFRLVDIKTPPLV